MRIHLYPAKHNVFSYTQENWLGLPKQSKTYATLYDAWLDIITQREKGKTITIKIKD